MALTSTLSLHPKQMEVYRSKARFRVVVAGRRWGKCLHTGTMISMADGTERPIESLLPGDMVMTVNENTYALEPRQVVAMHDNGIKETMTVKTASRSLRSTPNHPHLVNNRWVEAKDIKVGDLVAVPKRLAFGNTPMLSHEIDMLAIWLAEGRNYEISNTTPEILDLVRNAAALLGAGLTVASKNGVDWRIANGDRTGGPQTGSNNPMRRMLEEHGVWGKNSKTKFIPEAIFSLPESQVAQFLNRFIACDGCITRRSKNTWSLEIGLANENMVRQIAKLLHKFGIRGQIRYKKHAAKSSVSGNNFESWTLIVSTPNGLLYFAEKIGAISKEKQIEEARCAATASRGTSNSYLPIGHDDFVKHLSYTPTNKRKFGGYNAVVSRDLPEDLRLNLNSWRKQTPSRVSTRRFESLKHHSDGFFNPIADGDLAWEEVTAVELNDDAQTWDLSVEGNHNFIAEGVVTHNTALSRVLIITHAKVKRRKIWYVAPTYRMAKQIMWIDLLESIPKKWIRKVNETTLSITLVNGTRIELKGADKADSLRGVGVDFLVLDEFQDISQETWTKVLRPTLADRRGTAIFIGCVRGNTRVLSDKGIARIEDLSKSRTAKTLETADYNLYGINREFHKADGFWNNGVVITRKITTHMGFEIEASEPHPMLVMGDDGMPYWKRTEDIKAGDRIAIAQDMDVWGGVDPLTGLDAHMTLWSTQFEDKRGPKPKALVTNEND